MRGDAVCMTLRLTGTDIIYMGAAGFCTPLLTREQRDSRVDSEECTGGT
jgi:hypothetical protein